MRLFSWRGCVVRVHPIFLLMLFFLCIGGASWAVAAFLAALFLHESAHFICAVKLRLQIAQLELTPFGGSMHIPLLDALSPRQSFMLSFAGPACNVFFLFLSLYLSWRCMLFHPFLLYFIQCHAAMLSINLLPFLPLDGGRMLLALLSSKIEHDRLLRIFLLMGRVFAAGLIIAGIFLSLRGQSHLSWTMLGVYLLYAAAIEEKTAVSRFLASFMARRIRFEKRLVLPLHTLCASASMPVFMVIAHLRPGAYHIVNVVEDTSLHSLGQLHEDALLSAILAHSSTTLGELCSPRN